jgi:hypothetical protein
MPVIHAAVIFSATNTSPTSSALALVTRSWLHPFVGAMTSDVETRNVEATATDATAYLRIASLSIALYE